MPFLLVQPAYLLIPLDTSSPSFLSCVPINPSNVFASMSCFQTSSYYFLSSICRYNDCSSPLFTRTPHASDGLGARQNNEAYPTRSAPFHCGLHLSCCLLCVSGVMKFCVQISYQKRARRAAAKGRLAHTRRRCRPGQFPPISRVELRFTFPDPSLKQWLREKCGSVDFPCLLLVHPQK
jgi:hypothetical protein